MKIEVKLVPIREARQSKPRVYFWPEGETVLENLCRRTTRPHTEYRKFLDDVMATAMKLSGRASLMGAKGNWSKHAGCTMCPCSPGFILSGHSVHLFGYDIHVTISQEAVPPTTGGPELAQREAQLS